jgi:hypothetical protein
VVRSPGRTDDEYRLALRQSEVAHRAFPNNNEQLNTLGVAQYRVGRYREALDTLLHADRLTAEAYGKSIVFDLAFIAMCHHQLGHREEARVYLKRSQESIKEDMHPGLRSQAQPILREAEALIEGKAAEPKQ